MSTDSSNFTALLVDDELYFRRFISQVIGKSGVSNIVQAADGFEAVTQFEATKPDMVILDINMPNKNGLATLRDLRKTSDEVPIFMLTSTADEYIVEQCVVDGADFLLRKDVPANELSQQLGELIAENFPDLANVTQS
ncbi:MAG: response regulator [Verrucomicrobiia bacterium]|tara:strand:- start:223 stop:636 length:414 start_codon:yes stop_codon:yes gene_type:complete